MRRLSSFINHHLSSSVIPTLKFCFRAPKRAKEMQFRALILLSFALLSRVLAEPIYATHTGGTFGRSYREPKYDIKFHSKSFPFHPDDNQESVIMPGKDGQRFLCYLPKVEKAKNGKSLSPQNVSSVVMESEKWVKVKTPDELLEVLKDRCLLRQEGWWSYEFCHLGKVRQFHMEDEKVVQEFILGEYNAEATAAYLGNFSDNSILKDPRGKDASHRYHPHQFTNGTKCDLTDQPREIEVRFICAEPRAMINSITELATCKYALTVQCPTLCKHPLFQEEKPVEHTINCNELPGDDKEKRAEREKSEPKQIIMVTDAAAQDSTDRKEIEE